MQPGGVPARRRAGWPGGTVPRQRRSARARPAPDHRTGVLVRSLGPRSAGDRACYAGPAALGVRASRTGPRRFAGHGRRPRVPADRAAARVFRMIGLLPGVSASFTALTRWGFGELGLARIQWRAEAGNEASRRAVEAGFTWRAC